MSEAHSDKDLLDMFQQESSRHYAFNLIVRKHQERLYGFIRRMVTDPEECKDVMQNVFIKVWTGLPNFRADSKLYTWLHRIAHNESINHLKKQRRGLFNRDEKVFDRLTSTLDHSEHFSGDAIQKKLQRAVMRLPEKQRAVFIMKYHEEKKYKEIASITGTSVGALKSSFHIAVKKIESWLEKGIE